MKKPPHNPRVLVVTPEVTGLPSGMGDIANCLSAKAGGLADVSAALIAALFDHGADVHVAIPDYRTIFNGKLAAFARKEEKKIRQRVPEERIHLAEDRTFYYRKHIYSDDWYENVNVSLAFQREVINRIIPEVQPDLIHCNDWMTGLIPAAARKLGSPCLFTIHNMHSVKTTLAHIEDRGIDAAAFWGNLYYDRMPASYEETRNVNCVDFLTSGVFSAHFVNTVSSTFLNEVVTGRHMFINRPLQQEMANKYRAGCAAGILNAPSPSFSPVRDKYLASQYTSATHATGKRANKIFLQKTLGLTTHEHAPVFFWPSRLDTFQKGCRLLADILHHIVLKYWHTRLQVVFVANGEFQEHFNSIVAIQHLQKRVAVCSFNEPLSRLAYAASDFILMPSLFEPCGLPQMIGPLYGSLPVAHDTGGIHDTISHLDVKKNAGNGFLFKHFDANGLLWAIDQAMAFYCLPAQLKEKQIIRIMRQSAEAFNHSVTSDHYIKLYEKMVSRPLVSSNLMEQKVA